MQDLKKYSSKIILTAILLSSAIPANAIPFFSKKEKKVENFTLASSSPEEKKQLIMNESLAVPITVEKALKSSTVAQEAFIDITADQIFYDQESNYYEAIGDAQTFLPNKKATLYADTITYNGKTSLIEGTGNVKVIKGEELITGSYASFKVDGRELELGEPRVFVTGLKLKARVSKSVLKDPKTKKDNDTETIHFEDGIVAFTTPQSIYVSGNTPFTRYSQDIKKKNTNRKVDWNDLPDKPMFRYSAKEIIYDDSKKINNVKIKGARLHINDRISIPAPVHITTTVGERANTKFLGPIFGTRTRLGGFVFGPRFYKTIDKGTFALAPVGQIGNSFTIGGGAIASYDSLDSNTTALAGYGSLDNRFIANVHQQLPYGFETNYLRNQFNRGAGFGLSQVGQIIELAHKSKLRLPLLDEKRGIKFYNSVSYAKDNDELFSNRRLRDLLEERDGSRRPRNFDDNFSDFRSSHNVDAYTMPLLRLGNEAYNTTFRVRGQNSLRLYGNGDVLNIGRIGPALEFQLFKRITGEVSFLQAFESGDSPFLFDQFVSGRQAALFDADFKLNSWISLGGFASYNLSRDRFSRLQLRTDFGPKDFKLRLSYDTVRNQPSFGLNMIFGDPVEYDRLQVKI